MAAAGPVASPRLVSSRLLGERVWWAPAPLRALHRRFGLTESVPEAVPV